VRVPVNDRKCTFVRVTLLALVLVAVCTPILAQTQPARFWVAGRYDGNRIVVYFDAVKLRGTIPPNAPKLAYPVAEGFFNPVELPKSYIAGFQKGSNAEYFSVSDQYDLLLGNGSTATVILTTLIGNQSDEQVGNDSWIGALATVNNQNDLLFTKGYYALRRHQEPEASDPTRRPKPRTLFASLRDEPVRFDIQTRIASLLSQRMKTMATGAQRRNAENIPPTLEVEPFRVANGSLRYYARAEWRSGKEQHGKSTFVLGAWLTPMPRLQILAVETRTSSYDFEHELPKLLNVVDLGGDRTGIIVSISGDDGSSLCLVEYGDGVGLNHMRSLQTVGMGE
jgi:hypothetical protein